MVKQYILDKVAAAQKHIEAGVNVGKAIKRVGIAQPTFYRYREKIAKPAAAKVAKNGNGKESGADWPTTVNEVDELVRLKKENAYLRQCLGTYMMNEVLAKEGLL